MDGLAPTLIAAEVFNGSDVSFVDECPVAERLLAKSREDVGIPIKDIIRLELTAHWQRLDTPWRNRRRCLARAVTIYVEDNKGACILLAGVTVDETLAKRGLGTALTGIRAGLIHLVDDRIDDLFAVPLTRNGFLDDLCLPYLKPCPVERLERLPLLVEQFARTDVANRKLLAKPAILKFEAAKARPIYRAALDALKQKTILYTMPNGDVVDVPIYWDLRLADNVGLRKGLCQLTKEDEPPPIAAGQVA